MSVNIIIKNALKKFGNDIIIPNLSLEIKNSEFFTLLGPSGCGKTTLLRMIAGFNSIEGGEFYFNDKRINDISPGERNIGMVFQNYAIFPNMTVRKNVEFGLKQRKMSKEAIDKETKKFLEIVHVEQYADSMPNKLSGGQQQRVALARALVIKPDILLMDEPLSNLDAKLRVEMRAAIKNIQREVGITTVYVTHDQEEAMAVSDRIAVMKSGVIHQIGKPKDIYQRPSDLFVASFIGKSNLLKAKLLINNGNAIIRFLSGYEVSLSNILENELREREVIVSARPEELHISQDYNSKNGIKGIVKDSVFLGLNTHYFVTLETQEDVEVIMESSIDQIIPNDSNVLITLNEKKINIFDYENSLSIMKGVSNSI